jgi:hypothetical protein
MYIGRQRALPLRVSTFTSAHNLLYAAAYLGNLLHTRLAPHTGIYRLWQTKQLHALYSLPPATLQVFKRLAAASLPTPCQHACTNRPDTMPDKRARTALPRGSAQQEFRDLGRQP